MHFKILSGQDSAREISLQAQHEFDDFVFELEAFGIGVHVFEDDPQTVTPDSVFPNNWFSTHPDGTVVIYPMLAPSRRLERRADVVEFLQHRYDVRQVLDWSNYETEEMFLEGTGSIIFDHACSIAYANESARTSPRLLTRLCERLNYRPVIFHARDSAGMDIYHTNVLMGLADRYVVICLECIDAGAQNMVINSIQDSGREIISVDFEQVKSFAGNVIQLQGREGPLLVMSKTALQCLRKEQKDRIERHNPILAAELPVIEKYGGGSARCMIAGIHLESRRDIP